MNTTESYKFYERCYRICGPFIRFFRPVRVTGRENMIDGAVLFCANHSAMIDPILIALACDVNAHLHVFAKAELYKVPVVSWLIKKLGTIPVNRKALDVASIKTSLSYLKKGEKVLIFPEGTRLSEYDASAAKSGAVKLAERAGVPIVPVFLPRRKPLFKKSIIVFGKPYKIEKTGIKRSLEDYAILSKDLMNRIQSLEPTG